MSRSTCIPPLHDVVQEGCRSCGLQDPCGAIVLKIRSEMSGSGMGRVPKAVLSQRWALKGRQASQGAFRNDQRVVAALQSEEKSSAAQRMSQIDQPGAEAEVPARRGLQPCQGVAPMGVEAGGNKNHLRLKANGGGRRDTLEDLPGPAVARAGRERRIDGGSEPLADADHLRPAGERVDVFLVGGDV